MTDPNVSDPLEPEKPHMPLWGKLVLGASLAFNLLILGIVGGFLWMASGHGDRPPPRPFGGAVPYFRYLDIPDQRALAKNFREDASEFGLSRGSEREHREALIAILRADPFDPEALAALLSERHDAFSKLGERGQLRFSNYVADMSSAERLAVAQRIERWKDRPPRKDKYGNGKPPPPPGG
ncbi:MAG: periplasmic heavy metal sensor [Mangrovicoccus sp.]